MIPRTPLSLRIYWQHIGSVANVSVVASAVRTVHTLQVYDMHDYLEFFMIVSSCSLRI